jgi:sugar O-acyltransferase (sialic acid O-acetyltransferase NeuD family)
MRNLLIIGARGFGREVYNFFLHCKESLGDVECKGFLDDNFHALDDTPGYPPIIQSVEEYEPQPNDVFITALGDVHYKKKYTEFIKSKGGQFISLIDPQIKLGRNTTFGIGCIINKSAISCDVKFGDFVTLGVYSDIGHDVTIGSFCHLGAYTFMGGYSAVDDFVTIHPRVNILPHKRVGEHSIVGASSVVIKNVPAHTTVFGNPAKKVEF